MNEDQAGLKILEEELGELAIEILKLQQIVSKAQRFGLHESKDMTTTNLERIDAELNDVLGAVMNLNNLGVKINIKPELIALKVGKIEKYNNYSKQLKMIRK